jgi:CRISPR-associated protein Csm4
MNYYLYKLAFRTPVHFGESMSARSLQSSGFTLCADTLFSGLCHEAARAGGPDKIHLLASPVQKGELLFSDLFPYSGSELYLPRPMFPPVEHRPIESGDRKKLKKLLWIPISGLRNYCASLQGTAKLDVDSLAHSFGQMDAVTKVSLAGRSESKQPTPYDVGIFSFSEGCGLYGIAASKNAQTLRAVQELLKRLGYTGLGGKLSAGYGKYVVAEELMESSGADCGKPEAPFLFRSLEDSAEEHQLLLTTSLPQEREMKNALQGAYYSIRRRGGFVQSNSYADTPRKKQTQFFLASGSVLRTRFAGGLYDVSGSAGNHPVYRYARPLFMGVKLP